MTDLISDSHEIVNRIYTMRGQQVMLDFDLAEMYQVETRRINEQVKRNASRFPESYRFQLTALEWDNLKSQSAISSSDHGGRRTLPYAFTEQGIAMLSAVLTSEIAIQVSIRIIDTFVEMRKTISAHAGILQRLDKLEENQISYQLASNQKFEQIFTALEAGTTPKAGIFFDGQTFDAWTFISDLVRSAQSEIILIDNYVDDTVFKLFEKRAAGVTVTIYTKPSRTLDTDLQKHNEQYAPITLKNLISAHDRFIIIDRVRLYHFGASLKDAGKKWFAFSKMDSYFLNSVLKFMY